MSLKAFRRLGVAQIGIWCGVLCGVCLPQVVWAATPDSPEVRAMLDRGRAYLEKSARSSAAQLGAKGLVGLAAYKYQRRFQREQTGLPGLTQFALEHVLQASHDAGTLKAMDNYSLGISVVFLTEVHPADHTGELNTLLQELLSRQKPHGGWGYAYSDKGDTSQLQYAALGLWSAKGAGCTVPQEAAVNLINYVLRVQDPNGSWGYSGNDPGTFTRVPQTPMRPSLSAAGLGTLYVLSDFLGLSRGGVPRQVIKGIPAALHPVSSEEADPKRARGARVDTGVLKEAMSDGNAWFRQLQTLQTPEWQYYFLYGYERCNSFRELVEGTYEPEPRWYNDGVRLLKTLESPTGGWDANRGDQLSPQESDTSVSTAFAMLFLLRSTRETIEKVVDRGGVLRGGYDLPSDLSEVRLKDNKLVSPAIVGEVADMIELLEKDDADKIESLLDNPDSLSLSGLAGEGREYTARLTRVLRTGSYQARIVAARTLGRQGELDNVPILIYALSDGDPRVVREAQAGLRLTSRKFSGMDLPEEPTPAQIDSMAAQWKAWYKSVRPEGVFIEPGLANKGQ